MVCPHNPREMQHSVHTLRGGGGRASFERWGGGGVGVLRGEGGGGFGQSTPPPCLCAPKCITAGFFPFGAGVLL